ncbi:MAG: hypothetical protein HY703_08950 [Gemmatimonadetes bacterium]|nr:hypothetical protein [Gemmatimonadota bacterium]
MSIRLVTLGGLHCYRDGEEVEALPAQRLRCALLVYLALEREASRDTLVAVFWPERDAERSRHALTQTLYELRRTLGEDWVDAQPDRVRASRILGTDAEEFAQALERGAHGEALALYHGAFLHGVYLADNPQFESWVDRQRSRLERLHRRAQREFLDGRIQAGDLAGALAAAQRWVDVEPLEDEAHHRIIELLARTGQRTEALQHYEAYLRLLQKEELQPLDQTEALVARIRAGEVSATAAGSAAVPSPARPEPRDGAAERATAALSEPERPGPAATPRPVARWRARLVATARSPGDLSIQRWMRLALAPLLLLVLLAAIALWRRAGSEGAEGGVSIVVFPFNGSNTAPRSPGQRDSELHRLLANALDWLPGIRALDGAPLLAPQQSWRSISFPELLQRAEDWRARYVVTGEVLSAPGGATLSLDLYSPDGQRLLRTSGGESTAPSAREVERLALELGRAVAQREGTPLGLTPGLPLPTTSPAALTHLLEGQRRFGARDFHGATEAFARALAADSLAGLAYNRLAVAEIWRWDYAAALRTLEAGLARRERLAPEWVELLEAQRHSVRRHADSATAAFQRLVLVHPQMIDAWFGLGEALFHFGGVAGYRPADAEPAFERVASLDSAFAPFYYHLADLALYRGDLAQARAHLRRIRPDALEYAARAAMLNLYSPEAGTRARALDKLSRADRATISQLVGHFGHGGANLSLVDTLAAYLLGRGRTPDDRVRGAQYRLVARAAQGRWAEAVAGWDSAAGSQPFDRWIVHAYFAGYPAEKLALPMLDWARALTRQGRAPDFTRPAYEDAQEAFRALVHHAFLQGDSAEVRRLLGRLDEAAGHADAADPLPPALRAALLARLELLAGDSSAAIPWLEAAAGRVAEPIVAFFPHSNMAPQRLALAEILTRQGQLRQARRWLDSFAHGWSFGDLLFAARVTELRARLDLQQPSQSAPPRRRTE